MRALVLFAGSVAFVRNIVLCAGADVCILVLCFLVRCVCFFLWNDPHLEVMVWIVGVFDESAASWILFVMCRCWCTAAPSNLLVYPLLLELMFH